MGYLHDLFKQAAEGEGVKVVSLFAGIGGFDLGFSRAGFAIAAHVEKDAQCRSLLAAKWPGAVALDDVRTAGADNLPPCDVVTYGSPCQDLSVAGRRAGLSGARSGLFYEATRTIDELKPAYALFENVPGLLSSEGGRDFANVLIEMDRIGYSGAWRIIDAQYLGLAQRRRRCFGLFSRLDSGAERCAQVLLESEGVPGDIAKGREAGQGVAGTLESRAGGGGYPGTDGACAGHVVPTMTGNGDGHTGYRDAQGLIPALAGCLQERDAKGADSDTKPGHLVPVVYGFNGDQSEKTRSMGERLGQSPTLRSGGSCHVSTALHVRRLTPTECERLQGFPDGWTAGFPDSTRYRMLGNAVAVPVAEWIARRLYAAMKEDAR